MPFKSKAQRRKFAQLLVDGKISDQTYEEWNRSTGRKELPERLRPKEKSKASARTKRKAASPRVKRKAASRTKRKATSKGRKRK